MEGPETSSEQDNCNGSLAIAPRERGGSHMSEMCVLREPWKLM